LSGLGGVIALEDFMLLIKNARILTCAGQNYEKGYIACNEGKIVGIGSMESCPGAADGDQVIDAQEKYLMPGLVDPHCHIGMVEDGVGFEGDDVNEMTDPVTLISGPLMASIIATGPFRRPLSMASPPW
jgi:imidazolonepropionase-like amidohydrolase